MRCLFHFSLSIVFVAMVVEQSASAMLILGGTDQGERLTDGAQPGVAAVFNVPGRVAWWEGPPFGGGQYRSECRGDTAAFNTVLADFAKIEAKTKRLVIRDGIGVSFWLSLNRQREEAKAAEIDWVFTAWRLENWKRLKGSPSDLRPGDIDTSAAEPVPLLEVYTGGRIDWSEVDIPAGLEVVDHRMSARGFSASDGRVMQGALQSISTGAPLVGTVSYERRGEDRQSWEVLVQTPTDAAGEWTLTNVPAGTGRLVARSPGHASRILESVSVDGQPRWSRHDSKLAVAATVSGRVVGPNGQPIADASITLRNVSTDDGERYSTLVSSRVACEKDGRFRVEGLPTGWVSISASAPGHCHRGHGPDVIVPSENTELKLELAGAINIEVDFSKATKPAGYIINMSDARGERVGRWGGSGSIDDKNQVDWDAIPPGDYVVTGRPNPGSSRETTNPVTVTIVGGETSHVTLQAK